MVIVNNEAALDPETYKQQLHSGVWFLIAGIVFSLKMLHIVPNGIMVVLIKNVHSVGIINGVYADIKKMHGMDNLRRLLTGLHYTG
jgi:hypothetical protein